MAITLKAYSKKSISLEEYIDSISNINVLDFDQVAESAEKLLQLSNNKQFLVEKLNQELMTLNAFQAENSYSSQTLMLGGGKQFAVRANMWLPREEENANPNDDWESKLYSYALAHDHNFSFLTVGYWGSGYRTSIYEYDPEKIVGYAGEKVDLKLIEETSLPEGKIMYYRAFRDIHVQEEPDEFSVSLNLLIVSPELNVRNQYYFDLNESTIKSFVQTTSRNRLIINNLAKIIHDNTTLTLLEELSLKHINPNVRFGAFENLAYLLKDESGHLWKKAMADKSPFVQHMARMQMSQLA
jgi:hypothetical protein